MIWTNFFPESKNGDFLPEKKEKEKNHVLAVLCFRLPFSDIHMPIMDGLTCARLVRQFEKEHNLDPIPIIALTADATAMHRTACLEAGFNEFMSKPLDYPLLIEILKKLSVVYLPVELHTSGGGGSGGGDQHADRAPLASPPSPSPSPGGGGSAGWPMRRSANHSL